MDHDSLHSKLIPLHLKAVSKLQRSDKHRLFLSIHLQGQGVEVRLCWVPDNAPLVSQQFHYDVDVNPSTDEAADAWLDYVAESLRRFYSSINIVI